MFKSVEDRNRLSTFSARASVFVFAISLVFVYWLFISSIVNAKNLASARVDDIEIIINCDKSIEIKNAVINNEVEIERCYKDLILFGSCDTISIAGLFKSFCYKELGVDYLTDWDNKILIIDVWREGAKTAEGVKIGDSFSILESVYGTDFKSIISARNPNEQTIAYPKLGVLFFGTINPDKINVISISKLARYVRYIRVEKE